MYIVPACAPAYHFSSGCVARSDAVHCTHLTVPILVDRAIASSPVVLTLAGTIGVTLSMPIAVVQAVSYPDCGQVVAYLVHKHRVVDSNPPEPLHCNTRRGILCYCPSIMPKVPVACNVPVPAACKCVHAQNSKTKSTTNWWSGQASGCAGTKEENLPP